MTKDIQVNSIDSTLERVLSRELSPILELAKNEIKQLRAQNAKLQKKLNAVHEACFTDLFMANEKIDQLRAELAEAKPDWNTAPEWAERLVGHWTWQGKYYKPTNAGTVVLYPNEPEKKP